MKEQLGNSPDAIKLIEEYGADSVRVGLMLSSASGFYSSENYGKDEVRIAFVLNSEKLKNAIKIIKLGLKEFIG